MEAHEKRARGITLNGNGHAAALAETVEQRDARLRRMWDAWKRGTWPESWGPDPKSAGCEITKELIEQWSQQ